MMKRAFEGTEFAALDEHLEGPSAIAISKDDATAPARILCKFAKDAKALELKAGVVEGTVYDADGLGRTCKDSVKRRTSVQIAWKHTVTNYQSCSCYLIRSQSRAGAREAAQQKKLRQRKQQRLRQQTGQ